jgi:hypothetical protein
MWFAYLAIVLPLFLSIARSRKPQPAQATVSASA